MNKYHSIVVLSQDICEKVEHYKQFLSKSEFGLALEHTMFVSMDTAADLSAVVSPNLRNCIFVHGYLKKDEYTRHYETCESFREKCPNTNFFMLFCQDTSKNGNDAYVKSVKFANFNAVTTSIGILEEKDEDGLLNDEQKDDIRCIKLLSLVLSIALKNEDSSAFFIGHSYSTVKIDLNYKNIYYAVMLKLAEFSDEIKDKERLIKVNEDAIRILKKRKPRKCRGKYGEEFNVDLPEGSDKFIGAIDSADYVRKLESSYVSCTKEMEKCVEKDLKTARNALAVAQEHEVCTVIKDDYDDGIYEVHEEYDGRQKYMDIEEIKDTDILPLPEDLLHRADRVTTYDSVKINSVLGMTEQVSDFKRSFLKFLLTSVAAALLFALVVCSVYGIRYRAFGAGNVTLADFLQVSAVPFVIILASCMFGAVINLFRYVKYKGIFKELNDTFKNYMTSLKDYCNSIRVYLDKYLTVYYNNHLKNTQIEKLNGEILFLKGEVAKLKKAILPYNCVAETIHSLPGERIPYPKAETDEVYGVVRSVEDVIKDSINTKDKTVVRSSLKYKPDVSSPWIKSISFELGNFN